MEEEELKKAIEEMKDEFEIYTLPEYVVCSFEDKIKEIFQAGQLAEREKCLKMIEEWNNQEFESEEYGRFKVHKIGKKDMEDLQQKIKEKGE